MPVRIVKWRIHQDNIATRGGKTNDRKGRNGRRYIERCRVDAIGKLIAHGILGRKRRKVLVDLNERNADAGHADGERKASRTDSGSQLGDAVAISSRR